MEQRLQGREGEKKDRAVRLPNKTQNPSLNFYDHYGEGSTETSERANKDQVWGGHYEAVRRTC